MSKTRKITDYNIIDIICRDIKQMDADSLEVLIEHMYPVKATYDPETELIELTIDPLKIDNSISIEEIFGEKDMKLFEEDTTPKEWQSK